MESNEYERLVETAVACSLPADATKLVRFKALFALLSFLDDFSVMKALDGVIQEMKNLEPDLTDTERDELRALGCSFPGDDEWPDEDVEDA